MYINLQSAIILNFILICSSTVLYHGDSGNLSRYETSRQNLISADDIKNIPVVITKAKIQDPESPMALIISGDGGWFWFEQKIADQLAALGIPTIGLDSRKYFWSRKTPEATTIDMVRLFDYYGREWGKKKIVLIGYSLGSEIVPFIVTRLPEEMKSRVVSAVLLSPEDFTDFEIHISNMLGMGNSQNTYKVVDEIRKMSPVNTLLIFGAGEKSKVPAMLKGTNAKIRIIPGDHHYASNIQLIIQTMKENKAF